MCRSQASPGLEEKPEAVSLRPGGDPTAPTAVSSSDRSHTRAPGVGRFSAATGDS